MKKLTFFLILILIPLIEIGAQNANRSGFFIELAYGGIVGNGRVVEVKNNGSSLTFKSLSGSALNLSLGYRFSLSRSFALDARVEGQPYFYNGCNNVPVTAKLMVAPRYISPEIIKNMSLYVSAGVGISYRTSFSSASSYGDEYAYVMNAVADSFLEPDKNHYLMPLGGNFGKDLGVAYMLNIGINFTTHLYGGLIYNGDFTPDDSRVIGIIGAQIGYRF